MFAADENARPGRTDPRQAAETCSMAEFLLSDEDAGEDRGRPAMGRRGGGRSLPIHTSRLDDSRF